MISVQSQRQVDPNTKIPNAPPTMNRGTITATAIAAMIRKIEPFKSIMVDTVIFVVFCKAFHAYENQYDANDAYKWKH